MLAGFYLAWYPHSVSLVSAFAFAGGIMILKRKKFAFAIIATCCMMVKGATFIFSTGGDFLDLFIGTDIFALAVIRLIFTSISCREFIGCNAITAQKA